MKILLSGMNGRMGREIIKLAGKDGSGCRVIAGIDACANGAGDIPCAAEPSTARTDADVIIDFSHRSLTGELLGFAVKNGLPAVLATTGHTPEDKALIRRASEKIPVFYTANCSAGTLLLARLAREAAKALPEADIEIIETHRAGKTDAPSGTALLLAEELKKVRPELKTACGAGRRGSGEIGMHPVRIGNVAGIHEIIFGTANQTITLRHEAHSRALYAEGAIAAAFFIKDKEPGLYGMGDLTVI